MAGESIHIGKMEYRENRFLLNIFVQGVTRRPEQQMTSEIYKYFLSSFGSLAPLINPPGSAVELLGILGFGNRGLYQRVARKVAINTALFLTVTGLAGPYLLRCFGISLGILQVMGGLVLVGVGWRMLHKEEGAMHVTDIKAGEVGGDAAKSYWMSRAFYPLTYPITVGPCSVTVMLTISSQANALVPASRIFAWAGVMLCLLLMSLLIYVCYACAPLAGGAISPGIITGLIRVVPFLILCIGAQLSWNGIRLLLKTLHA